VVVFPRPTAHDSYSSSFPVEVDAAMLRSKFDLRLCDAAKSLRISVTSFKQVCRKLGIERWPRRLRPRKTRPTEGASGSSGSTQEMRSPPPESSGSGEGDDDNDDSAPDASRKRKHSAESHSTHGSSSGGTSGSSRSNSKCDSESPAHSKYRQHEPLDSSEGSQASTSTGLQDDTFAFLDAASAHSSLPTPAALSSLQVARDVPALQLLMSMRPQTPALHHLISGATRSHTSWGANAIGRVTQYGNAPLASVSGNSMTGQAQAGAHMG
jgi:hypothetical protein